MKCLYRLCGLLLSALALSSQILNTNGYTDTTTSGVSGPACPPNAQCLSDAVCINNTCKCSNPATPEGLGHFLCHRPNQIFCAVLNDPFIRGFDESTTHAPLSCKFKLTDLRIPLCDSRRPNRIKVYPTTGTCYVKVQAWGARLRGKTFIKGMDFRFKLDHVDGVFHHLVRIIATAKNGLYLFKESGTHVPNAPPSTGPAKNRTILSGRIDTAYDHVNNFARIVVDFCGVEVGIRGVDTILNPRDTTAGVYIKVFEECQPNFVNSGETLCSPPAGMGPSLADKAKELSKAAGRKVSTSVAAMHTVMTSDVEQTFPGAAPVLAEVTNVSKECPDELFADAMEQSSFILIDIKFMKCFDRTASLEKALELFKNSVNSICTNNLSICAEVQKEVSMSNCTVAVTEGTIMEKDCGELPK